MKLLSNAKINLNLKIRGFKNGFHQIDSTIIPISIYDSIEILSSKDDSVIGMDINEKENIIYKAIKLFKKRFCINDCVTIKIKKDIPMQAGLGGGSSNAAFVLKGLRDFFAVEATDFELAKLSIELGSDVPFFIFNKPSLVMGRGEIIEPIVDFKKIYGVIVFDNLSFSTKDVYCKYDNIEKCFHLENDLELAARELSGGERIISIEKDLYDKGAYKSSLTGSGGAVFGLFKSEEHALRTVEELKNRYYYVKFFYSI